MEIPAAAAEALLERWPVARLALPTDGAPHVVPIVFARLGATLWSPIDGKPKREGELARVRLARGRPRASLLLDHYDADWTRLWWLRVEGRARVVAPPGGEADPEVAAVRAALLAKYPQYASTPVLRPPATLLAIDPLRVRGWCAGPAALETPSAPR